MSFRMEKAYLIVYRFIASDKKTQVLPHMPPERRKFVHDVRILGAHT